MSVFLQDLIYLTIQEYKDSSASELTTKTNDEIQIMIGKAEDRINAKINYTTPSDIADVDVEIKKATVILTDCFYEVENQTTKSGKELIEEKDENHTRKYQIIGDTVLTYEKCMSSEIEAILKPYITSSYPRFFRT